MFWQFFNSSCYWFYFCFWPETDVFRCGAQCFWSTQRPFPIKLGLRSSYCAYTPKNKNNQKTSLWCPHLHNFFLSTSKHMSKFLWLVVEQMFGFHGDFALCLFITSDTNLLHVDQLQKKKHISISWKILLFYSLIFQDFPHCLGRRCSVLRHAV